MVDVLLGVVLLVVLAILAVPVAGTLRDWKACGLYLPRGVNASVLALGLGGFLLSSWGIGLALMAVAYMLFAMFGSHGQRSLLDAERSALRVGKAAGKEAEQAQEQALAAELAGFRALTRTELIERLFKVTEKEVTTSEGSRGRVRIEVLPQAYRWEGGNTRHFDRLRESVRSGESIKVIGVWVPEGQDFLRRRNRLSRGFRMDAEGAVLEL